MDITEYKNYQERKTHGTEQFPYATYLCTIPLDFSCVPMHWHNEIEIIYVKKGKGLVTVNFESYIVTAGSILFIIPGQIHSIGQYEDIVMEYENIVFKPELLLSRSNDASNTYFLLPLFNETLQIPVVFTPDMPYYRDIVSCIDAADEICKTCPDAYQFAVKGQLYLMFYTLFSKCCKKELKYRNDKSLDKMKAIIKYVENNYRNKISIHDISNELSLSQSHFMRLFKNTMGTSFINYLNEYRLTMASKLLISSDAAIIQIAAEVGFENLSYFNRLFKKQFGVSPREFRKRLNKNENTL